MVRSIATTVAGWGEAHERGIEDISRELALQLRSMSGAPVRAGWLLPDGPLLPPPSTAPHPTL